MRERTQRELIDFILWLGIIGVIIFLFASVVSGDFEVQNVIILLLLLILRGVYKK